MIEDEFDQSGFPSPPPEKEIQKEVAKGMTNREWSSLDGAWWQTADYSDFAPRELKEVAEKGKIDKEGYVELCKKISEQARKPVSTPEEVTLIQNKFKELGIKLDAEGFILLMRSGN